MPRWICGIATVLLLLTLQCGTKMDQEEPEAIRRRAEGMLKLAQSVREFRKEVRSRNKDAQPGFCRLDEVLPDPLPGWRATTKGGDPTDSALLSTPFGLSVGRTYRSGGKVVSIEIIDTKSHSISLPEWVTQQEALPDRGLSEDHPEGDRAWPRFEAFEPDKGEGTLEVFCGGRFLVRLHGRGIKTPAPLHAYLELTALNRLPSAENAD